MSGLPKPLRIHHVTALALRVPVERLISEVGDRVLVGSARPSGDPDDEWQYQTRVGGEPLTRSTGSFIQVFSDDALVLPLVKANTYGAFANTILIGRSSSNDVQIEDPSVSKLHARIELRTGQTPLLKDAGSKNGSYVNGNQILRQGGADPAPG